MKSEKIFEFAENSTRGYFTFFRLNNKMVLSLPKDGCPDRDILVGTSIDNLKQIQPDEAKALFDMGMNLTLKRHPRFKRAIAQLGF